MTRKAGRPTMGAAPKKQVTLRIDLDLKAQAKAAGINLSQLLERSIAAKQQIKIVLTRWATERGYDQAQIDHLLNVVCANAVQYSFNIGKDTELSAIEVLQSDIAKHIDTHPQQAEILPLLLCMAARYAQAEAMQAD